MVMLSGSLQVVKCAFVISTSKITGFHIAMMLCIYMKAQCVGVGDGMYVMDASSNTVSTGHS